MKRSIVFLIAVFILGNCLCYANDNGFVEREEMACKVMDTHHEITGIKFGMPMFSSKPYNDIDYDSDNVVAIYNCCDEGIMNGMDNGNFEPHSLITRAQCASIAHRLIDAVNQEIKLQSETKSSNLNCKSTVEYDVDKETEKFVDDQEFPQWASGSIYIMKQLGFMIGDENNKFNPDEYLTEEQINIVLDKVVEAYRSVDSTPTPSPNEKEVCK